MKKLNIDLSQGISHLKILTNKLVNTNFVGGYRSVFKGKGLEFEDYRPYSASDDASLIDWRASLKCQQLLIKEFTEERNLNVFFLIDVSSSMVYSSTDKLKMEYAAELISTLSYVVVNAGDGIGFALFNDKIKQHSPPKVGNKPYYLLIRTLVDAKNYGGGYDIGEALRFTLSFLKESSIVIIVSDFIGMKNNWKQELKVLGKKFDVIGVMIRDPLDKELPEHNGQVVFGDLLSGKSMIVDVGSVREEYKMHVKKNEAEINQAFLNAGADFVSLSTQTSFVKPITDLFLRRAKK